jgi:hypothetical protein
VETSKEDGKDQADRETYALGRAESHPTVILYKNVCDLFYISAIQPTPFVIAK